MSGHIRDLRQRKSQPYTGNRPWQARWHNPQDPRQRVERSFPTKAQARQWLAEADYNAKLGQSPITTTYTLQDAAQEWFDRNRDTWQATTAHKTGLDLHAWLAPTPARNTDPIGRRFPLSHRRLTSLQAYELQAWRDEIQKQRTRRTAVKLFGILYQVLAYAVRQGYLHNNPAQNVEPLRTPQTPSRPYGERADDRSAPEPQADPLLVLEPAEINKLAAALEEQHPPYAVAVAFDAVIGLRAGELWGLRRRDFNPSRQTVSIMRSFKQVKGELLVGPLKSKAAQRTITLPPSTQALIDRQLATLPADPDALVFTAPGGGPVRHSRFYETYFKPAVAAALPHKAKLRFHDLRHTAASLMLSGDLGAGALILVKQRLGHKNLATTVDIYTHLLPQADADVAAALERQLVAPPATSVVMLPQPGSGG